MASRGKKEDKKKTIEVQPLNEQTAKFKIIGNAPLVQHRMSQKVRKELEAAQSTPKAAKKTRKDLPPKDFEECYKGAMHITAKGKYGIPVMAFKNAMLDAGVLLGIPKTDMRKCIRVEPDSFSADGDPLVIITKGKPHMDIRPVRLPNGSPDMRARPMFPEGWEATVTITFDADILSLTKITNLLYRAGAQIGILEGRPSSKSSTGMGWGTFRIEEHQ